MKKLLLSICLLSVLTATAIVAPSGFAFAEAQDTEKDYKALFVMDYDTGTVVYEENADEKYPIASMVKIMTLALTFNEIEKGNLTFDEKLTISDYAAGMGGSQLFLDAGEEYTVSDLIKGVVVCSANDAATALGERINGNISNFVDKMNDYAHELGMNNTLFSNATGLPSDTEQYSTARDVSKMMQKVLSYPKYYDYSKIWMEDYVHPDGRTTEIVNTNKLIRFMSECDGGKTGFTNAAGFCLSATAKKGDTRVIATLLGAKDGKKRFATVSNALRAALAKYETKIYMHKNETFTIEGSKIQNAADNEIELYCGQDLKSFGEKNESTERVEIVLNDGLKAPIAANEQIGTVYIINENGERIAESGLYTVREVKRKGFFEHFREIVRNRYFSR